MSKFDIDTMNNKIIVIYPHDAATTIAWLKLTVKDYAKIITGFADYAGNVPAKTHILDKNILSEVFLNLGYDIVAKQLNDATDISEVKDDLVCKIIARSTCRYPDQFDANVGRANALKKLDEKLKKEWLKFKNEYINVATAMIERVHHTKFDGETILKYEMVYHITDTVSYATTGLPYEYSNIVRDLSKACFKKNKLMPLSDCSSSIAKKVYKRFKINNLNQECLKIKTVVKRLPEDSHDEDFAKYRLLMRATNKYVDVVKRIKGVFVDYLQNEIAILKQFGD